MSQESLEQFMEKVGSNEELRASVENQLDSDGNISVDALITLGAENGCEFTTEDLTQNLELSDEELDGVAGGSNQIDFSIELPQFVSLYLSKIDFGWYFKVKQECPTRGEFKIKKTGSIPK